MKRKAWFKSRYKINKPTFKDGLLCVLTLGIANEVIFVPPARPGAGWATRADGNKISADFAAACEETVQKHLLAVK